ncbi:hypothetical protein ACFSLT_18805 [Novosphingobium resinovorum]|uniref:hypothetical protein n=1 Tax=Novosphingobium resinovorum TaxID=158500 RepID=UPI0036157304
MNYVLISRLIDGLEEPLELCRIAVNEQEISNHAVVHFEPRVTGCQNPGNGGNVSCLRKADRKVFLIVKRHRWTGLRRNKLQQRGEYMAIRWRYYKVSQRRCFRSIRSGARGQGGKFRFSRNRAANIAG